MFSLVEITSLNEVIGPLNILTKVLMAIIVRCFDLPSMWVKLVYTSEAVLDLSALSIDLFGFLFLAWHQWQVIMSANIINNINSSGTDILSDYLFSTILSICLHRTLVSRLWSAWRYLSSSTNWNYLEHCMYNLTTPHIGPKNGIFWIFPPLFLIRTVYTPCFPPSHCS